MKVLSVAAVAALGVAVSGCAYTVKTDSRPQLDVYSNYTNKVPGKWALVIEDDTLNRPIRTTGIACSLNSFPLDMRSSFKASAIATFQNIAEEIEIIDHPIPTSDFQSHGFAGQIQIKGEEIRSHLLLEPGFWSATADASIEIDAGLVVDGPNGRLLGTRATGKGTSQHDAGVFCDKVSLAVSDAAELSTKDVLGSLGERFTNAPQVRNVSSRPVSQR